jgi:hypothetical protein
VKPPRPPASPCRIRHPWEAPLRAHPLVTWWAGLLLLAGTAGCGSTAAPLPDDGLTVLFVGNSLTQANDLPGMVAALASAAGVNRFRYEEVSLGGSSLQDHWADGGAVTAIEGARWDVVVLQQGPSSLESSRLNLIEYAERFAGKIRERGARPALYMVWPDLGTGDGSNWDAVTRSYTDAALAVDGMLFPAGEALRAIHATEPQIPVFDADQFHPSRAGTYLAALVIIGALTGRSTEGLSLLRPIVDLTPAERTKLERAADQANRDHGIP